MQRTSERIIVCAICSEKFLATLVFSASLSPPHFDHFRLSCFFIRMRSETFSTLPERFMHYGEDQVHFCHSCVQRARETQYHAIPYEMEAPITFKPSAPPTAHFHCSLGGDPPFSTLGRNSQYIMWSTVPSFLLERKKNRRRPELLN